MYVVKVIFCFFYSRVVQPSRLPQRLPALTPNWTPSMATAIAATQASTALANPCSSPLKNEIEHMGGPTDCRVSLNPLLQLETHKNSVCWLLFLTASCVWHKYICNALIGGCCSHYGTFRPTKVDQNNFRQTRLRVYFCTLCICLKKNYNGIRQNLSNVLFY